MSAFGSDRSPDVPRVESSVECESLTNGKKVLLQKLACCTLKRNVDSSLLSSAFRILDQAFPEDTLQKKNLFSQVQGESRRENVCVFSTSSSVETLLESRRIAIAKELLRTFSPLHRSLRFLHQEAATLSRLFTRAKHQLELSASLASSDLGCLAPLHNRRLRVDSELNLCRFLSRRFAPSQRVAEAVRADVNASPLPVSQEYLAVLYDLKTKIQKLEKLQRAFAPQCSPGYADSSSTGESASLSLVDDLLKICRLLQELAFERLFLGALTAIRKLSVCSSQQQEGDGAAAVEAFFSALGNEDEEKEENGEKNEEKKEEKKEKREEKKEKEEKGGGALASSADDKSVAPGKSACHANRLLWKAVAELRQRPCFFVQCVLQLLKIRRQVQLRRMREAGDLLSLSEVDALQATRLLCSFLSESAKEEEAFANKFILLVNSRRSFSGTLLNGEDSDEEEEEEEEEEREKQKEKEAEETEGREPRRIVDWKTLEAKGTDIFEAESISSLELSTQLMTRDALKEAVCEALRSPIARGIERALQNASSRASADVLRLAFLLFSEAVRLHGEFSDSTACDGGPKEGSALNDDRQNDEIFRGREGAITEKRPCQAASFLSEMAEHAYSEFELRWSREALLLPPLTKEAVQEWRRSASPGILPSFVAKFADALADILTIHAGAMADHASTEVDHWKFVVGLKERRLEALVLNALSPVLNYCRKAVAFLSAREACTFQINALSRIRKALRHHFWEGSQRNSHQQEPPFLARPLQLVEELLEEEVGEVVRLETQSLLETLETDSVREALEILENHADAEKRRSGSLTLSSSSVQKFWSEIYGRKPATRFTLIAALLDEDTQRRAREEAVSLLVNTYSKVYGLLVERKQASPDVQTPETLRLLLLDS